MTDEQVRILRHSLGADSRQPGYRNNFATHSATPDYSQILGLIDQGLMEVSYESNTMTYFRVTARGQELIGVKEID